MGLLCRCSGVFGSWCASKTQLHFPEHFLGLFLGVATTIIGMVYVLKLLA